MNEQPKRRRADQPEEERRQVENHHGQLAVPAWTAAVTVILAWAAGISILVFELQGQGRITVLGLAAWLITLPIVALDPIEAIRVGIRETLGNRRRS